MSEEDEEREEDVERVTDEKKKERPWYKELSPTVLIIAAAVIFFIIQNIANDPENKNTYILWIIGIGVLLFFLSKSGTTKEGPILTPEEAELKVLQTCERKRKWGQFDMMSKYQVGPISHLQKRDGGGQYYEIGVRLNNPYNRPETYVATVMARGPERGFVTMQESIGPITGREKVQERTIIPPWFRDAENSALLERMLFK